MFTYIFTSVFHRILDFKTGLNFYSDPFFMPSPVAEAFAQVAQSNGVPHKKIRLSFQTASILTNPGIYNSLFFCNAAFLHFFDLCPDLCFNFYSQFRIVVK
jgi:hypothetical protein